MSFDLRSFGAGAILGLIIGLLIMGHAGPAGY
jgi:hypothetical protein